MASRCRLEATTSALESRQATIMQLSCSSNTKDAIGCSWSTTVPGHLQTARGDLKTGGHDRYQRELDTDDLG
jgi:hypothetical protein